MARTNTTEAPATEEPRTVVYLGNRKAISIQDGERVPYPGKLCTTVRVRPDATLMEAAQEILSPNGVWAAHSDGPPAWVAAEGPYGPALAGIIASQFGCDLRDPDPEG
jgi:hypothetical protein